MVFLGWWVGIFLSGRDIGTHYACSLCFLRIAGLKVGIFAGTIKPVINVCYDYSNIYALRKN